MMKKNRKGLSTRKINTKVFLEEDHKPEDILFCECKLEYDDYTVKHANTVYCEVRGGFLESLRGELTGKMPNVVHLKIIKKLGEAQL